MSVQPIDLQVLFARLNQIGREQAMQRDVALQSQAVTAQEIVDQSDEKGHAVTEPDTSEDGPETLNDRQAGGQQAERDATGSGRENDAQMSGDQKSFFHDPDLGQNVDISG